MVSAPQSEWVGYARPHTPPRVAARRLPGAIKTSKKPVTEKNPLPSPTKQGDPSPKERLLELKKLLDDGLINQEDYDLKKRQILKDI